MNVSYSENSHGSAGKRRETTPLVAVKAIAHSPCILIDLLVFGPMLTWLTVMSMSLIDCV